MIRGPKLSRLLIGLKSGTRSQSSLRKLKREIVILGVLILIAGVGIAAFYGFHARTRVFGAYGIAVIGALVAVGGVMMGSSTTKSTSQFTCAKCGSGFGSQAALDQHSRDKHPL